MVDANETAMSAATAPLINSASDGGVHSGWKLDMATPQYAMAQLGAIAVWKNYKENPAEGLAAYKRALSLGYTVSIGEVYEAAGIKFDFSTAYIKSLVDFVQHEMEQL